MVDWYTYKDKRERFDPACHGAFFSQNITETVHRERFGYCIRRRQVLGEVVESISNSGVFHDITLVQDIRSRSRNRDVQFVLVGGGRLGEE